MAKIKKKRTFRLDVFAIISLLIIGIYCFSLLFMLGWGILSSFKHQMDFINNIFGLPQSTSVNSNFGWRFDNYLTAFEIFKVSTMSKTYYLEELFLNSFIYSVSQSFFHVGTCLMTGYACAKYRFRLNKLIYTTAIIVMLIPIVGNLPSEMQFAKFFFGGVGDINLLELCIMKCQYTGVYFLVFYSTYKSISWTYAEAAQLDGAGHFSIFWKIMLPLGKSTISAVFILLFIQYWNDYYTPMIFWPQRPTIAYALYWFQRGNRASSKPILMSVSFLATLPVLIVFIIFRDKIMGNLTMGGLKG